MAVREEEATFQYIGYLTTCLEKKRSRRVAERKLELHMYIFVHILNTTYYDVWCYKKYTVLSISNLGN